MNFYFKIFLKFLKVLDCLPKNLLFAHLNDYQKLLLFSFAQTLANFRWLVQRKKDTIFSKHIKSIKNFENF